MRRARHVIGIFKSNETEIETRVKRDFLYLPAFLRSRSNENEYGVNTSTRIGKRPVKRNAPPLTSFFFYVAGRTKSIHATKDLIIQGYNAS